MVEVADYLTREHAEGRLPARESWLACASMIIGACQHYVYTEFLSTSGMAGLLPSAENPVREYARTIVRTLFGVPE
ncbi:hypothetical protein B0I33_10338 [Prauserella shujinwangii]|uniref:Tetracyclin repressor-like C-terminal domain-containing protein n=1 Tax=Prauserella shujinwangii TaxID=1453103 RepID=A0A2T0LY07_9PSEU|nr:hypothetical protein [Prauserella shujinwangii]PRX49006.1 hypothetical protein B0I33_10338 [Prauserella shujinwangii]